MVVMASVSDLTAAILLSLGLLTPLGVLAAAGTMTLAGLTMPRHSECAAGGDRVATLAGEQVTPTRW